MFKYYLQLGLRSLCRNPVLTALMMMAIGFCVASSMTTYTVAFEFSRWFMGKFELAQLSPAYVLVGVVILLLLSHGAPLAPVLRAARIAPVKAIQSS